MVTNLLLLLRCPWIKSPDSLSPMLIFVSCRVRRNFRNFVRNAVDPTFHLGLFVNSANVTHGYISLLWVKKKSSYKCFYLHIEQGGEIPSQVVSGYARYLQVWADRPRCPLVIGPLRLMLRELLISGLNSLSDHCTPTHSHHQWCWVWSLLSSLVSNDSYLNTANQTSWMKMWLFTQYDSH